MMQEKIKKVKILQEFNLDDGSGDAYPIFNVGEIHMVVEKGYNGWPMILWDGDWYDVVDEDEDGNLVKLWEVIEDLHPIEVLQIEMTRVFKYDCSRYFGKSFDSLSIEDVEGFEAHMDMLEDEYNTTEMYFNSFVDRYNVKLMWWYDSEQRKIMVQKR